MTDPIFLVSKGKPMAPFGRLPSTILRDAESIEDAYSSHRTGIWIVLDINVLLRHARSLRPLDFWHRMLVFESASTARRELLSALFRVVVAPDHNVRILPAEELVEALASETPEDLFIGGVVDQNDRAVVLYRGNLDRLVVPLDWFRSSGRAPKPDPSRFSVTDYGQTVRLGRFEASADAILYEFDSESRRRLRAREVERAPGFGASLRRLRLQKGLSRADFSGITDKTIARIERGEVEKPHDETLRIIADRLGVRPEEIENY